METSYSVFIMNFAMFSDTSQEQLLSIIHVGIVSLITGNVQIVT